MRYFENSTIFHFTWDQVAQGFWRRYPNPYSNHVLSEDTISREVKNGKLYSKRILTKTNRIPKWGERLVPSRVVKIVEESVVDPNEKLIVTYTKNIGLAKILTVDEKMTYKASEENSDWTVAHQCALFDSQLHAFKSAIIAFGIERFKKNCKRMVKGFNHVLSEMFPHTAAAAPSEESSNIMSKPDKLRDVAKTASEIAKSKANAIFASCEPKEL